MLANPVILLVAILGVSLSHFDFVSAAGYSCNGQTFSTAEVIAIDVAAENSLTIQACRYDGGLSIKTNPNSAVLTNFSFTITDTDITGDLTFTSMEVGSGTTFGIDRLRATGSLTFYSVNVNAGGTVTVTSSSGSQLQWSGGSISGRLEVRNSAFAGSSYPVSFSSAPTSGVGAVQRWIDNTITSNSAGGFAMYYASSGFDSGATFELTGNIITTPNSASSYALYIDTTAGLLKVDGTNRFRYGGVYIMYTDVVHSNQLIVLKDSNFVAPVSIEVAGTGGWDNSKLELSGSSFESSFWLATGGYLKQCAINVLGSTFSTAPSISLNSLYQSTLSMNDTVISAGASLVLPRGEW
jgi:hypothetical protein